MKFTLHNNITITEKCEAACGTEASVFFNNGTEASVADRGRRKLEEKNRGVNAKIPFVSPISPGPVVEPLPPSAEAARRGNLTADPG
jgi:hypothetical protein